MLLAGYDETFSSTQQLVQCVRPGILLDAASVPSVQMTNRNGQVLPLNRYILDYWGHGQKQALVHANGMREGVLLMHLYDGYLHVWDLLASTDRVMRIALACVPVSPHCA